MSGVSRLFKEDGEGGEEEEKEYDPEEEPDNDDNDLPDVPDIPKAPRGKAEFNIEVPGGTVRRFMLRGKPRFLFMCSNVFHGTAENPCQVSRAAHKGRRRSQGRPLGFGLGFCSLADDDTIESAEDHLHTASLLEQPDRARFRLDFRRDQPEDAALAEGGERSPRTDEEDEPFEQP
jgi:hypothetical protein